MKILIDTLAIRTQKAGVGVYAINLVEQLVRLASDPDRHLQLFLLAQDDDPDFDYSGHLNVTMIWARSRLFRALPLRILYEQFVLPWFLLIHAIDVVHSLHYSFPLIRFGTRQVVTLHDMTFFRMPENHVPLKVVWFRMFIRAAMALADAIIFVSKSAQADCLSILGKPRGISTVIHHGKGSGFRPQTDHTRMGHIRAKYNMPANYILYIGTIEPRKNLSTLVSAFATLSSSQPDLYLVLAGMKGWNDEFNRLNKLISSRGVQDKVIFPGFIQETDKPLLLAGAAVFAYPSLYEGFGLPVLEALACGVPTVTSNTSSLPEVAGEAAVLVDPTNQSQWAEALESLIVNPSRRQELRTRSILQANKFSWRKTAMITAGVYAGATSRPLSVIPKISRSYKRKLTSTAP